MQNQPFSNLNHASNGASRNNFTITHPEPDMLVTMVT